MTLIRFLLPAAECDSFSITAEVAGHSKGINLFFIQTQEISLEQVR